MNQNGSGATQEEIKRRLNQRLVELRWDLKDVAKVTGDSYRSIQNWLRKDVGVPADFLSRFATNVPVNPTWLLTGEESPAPTVRTSRELVFELCGRALDLARDPIQEPEAVDAWLLACLHILSAPATAPGRGQGSSE